MKKRLLSLALCLALCLGLFPFGALAEEANSSTTEEVEATYVAEMNGEKYETLIGALAAANAAKATEATVTILQDTELTEDYSYKNSTAKLILDLNGKRIDSVANSRGSSCLSLESESNAKAEIKDSASNEHSYIKFIQANKGTEITVNGGYIDTLYICAATVNIHGGTINTLGFHPGSGALRSYMEMENGRVRYLFTNGSSTLSAKVSGGSFDKAKYHTKSDWLVTGYAFQQNGIWLTRDRTNTGVDYSTEMDNLTVEKCVHPTLIETTCNYCGMDKSECTHENVNVDGSCPVCGYQYAFAVGTGETRTFYNTFNDACSALSNSGGTISLLKDADTIELPDATFTLDLNGKTVASMSATSDNPTLKATGGGTITLLKVRNTHPVNLLESGFAFANNTTKELVNGYKDSSMPLKELTSITIVEHTVHTYKEDGSCGCGYTCPHSNFDNNYKCEECGNQLVFQVNNGDGDNSRSRYYVASKFSNALNDSSSNGTLTLLADAQISSNPREFSGKTFDLNGKDITCSDPMEGSSYSLCFIGNSKLTTKGNSNIQRGYFCVGRPSSNIGGNLIIDGPITFSMGFILYSGAKMTATNGVTFSYLKNYGNSIQLGSLLGTGYAFQNTKDNQFVEYHQNLDHDAYIEHIKAVLCTGHELNENGYCKWCNAGPYQAMIDTTYYKTINAAIDDAKNGDTVKLLVDVTADTTISSPLTLDLNGKNVTNLTASAGATIKDSGKNKGTIDKLTVTGGTLADLLAEGDAFKSGESWVNGTLTSAENVTVVQAPLTITGPNETELSIPYQNNTSDVKFVFHALDDLVSQSNPINITYKVDNTENSTVGHGNNAERSLGAIMSGFSAGTHTLTVTASYNNYTVTSQKYTVHVVQSQTSFVVKVYNDSEITNTFNYGDTVTIQGKVNATGVAAVTNTLSLLTDSEPTENYIEVYEGNTKLGYSPAFTNNFGVATIDTRSLGVGEHTLTVKYIGNSNMASQETTATVTVNKATPVINWTTYPYGKIFSGTAIANPTSDSIQIHNGRYINFDLYDNTTYKWYEATKNTADNSYTKISETALEGNPVNAGDYIIEAHIAATENTEAAICSQGVTISKAQAYGKPINVTVTAYNHDKEWEYTESLSEAVKDIITTLGGNLALNEIGVTYYSNNVKSAIVDGDILKITMNSLASIPPTEDGTQVAEINVNLNSRNYNQVTLKFNVKVFPKPTKPLTTFSMEGWTYGDTANEPQFTKPVDSATPVITYTKDGASVEKPTDAGNYTVTVKCETDDAIYTGSADFTIARKSIADTDVTLGEQLVYNGSEQTKSYSVTEGITYEVTGDKATTAGTYTLTITGTGNYTGTVEKTWTIAPKTVTATVTLSDNSFVYNGSAFTPDVTVKDGETTIPAAEYDVAYSSNTNAGIATVTITDKTGGNYAISEVSKTFEIAKANQTITAEDITATYGDTDKKVAASGIGTLTYTVKSCKDIAGKDSKVITVNETTGALTFQEAGTATITITAAGDTNYNPATKDVTVTVATKKIIIRAKDKSAYVGSTAPDLSKPVLGTDYEIEGLVGKDTLKIDSIQLSYETTPDMTKPGTYSITIGIEYDSGGRYEAERVPGTLTITTRPSSGSSGSTGTKTDTVKNPDGSTTKTETKADGSKTETTTASTPGGSTGSTVTKTDANGSNKTEASAKLSDQDVKNAQETGGAVTVPVKDIEAAKDPSAATEVKIDLPKNAGKTTVEIPVEGVTSGTVAVIVHPDGTEEIAKTSQPTEDGVQLELDGSTTVKIIDNSKDFIDTRDHWSRDEVNFVAARELFTGVGGNRFGVSEAMTRGMVNTVLARLAGVDTTPGQGQTWYAVGTDWAMKHGITDGTNPTANVTREQLATLLYRYAGSPAVSGSLTFADAATVSDYAKDALLWANQNGIVNGVGSNTIAPKANAERAQVAAMFARYLQNQ